MSYCGKCGAQLSDGDKFCPKCGNPCNSVTSQETEETKSVLTSPKQTKKPFGMIIAAVLILAVIGGGWFVWKKYVHDYSLEGLAKSVVNYDWVENFYDGLAMVRKGEKVGFIDKMGNEVIPCKYILPEMEANYHFSDGLALVSLNNEIFYINKKGEKAFQFNYDWTSGFSEGYAVVEKSGKYGFIDTNGKEVVPCIYDSANDFSDGMAAVIKGDKYGYIDSEGNLVIPISLEGLDEMNNACSFHDGLAQVEENGKIGYINKEGKKVIPCKFDSGYSFNEGLAAIEKAGKYGFIDKSGDEVISCEYDEANCFSEGLAFVKKGEKGLYIDKKGNRVLEFDNYSFYSEFKDGLAMVTKQNGDVIVSGYIDKNGKEVIPCEYDSYRDFSEGLVVVEKGGFYGLFDKNGKSTFNIENEEVRQIVQQKIKEKEEKKRMEEERMRKYEEEHGATGTFNAITNNHVWKLIFTDNGTRHYIALYFYPINRTKGMVSIVQYVDDGHGGFLILKDSKRSMYEISDDVIYIGDSFEVFPYETLKKLELSIVKNNDYNVKLCDNSPKWVFNMNTPEFKDPIK